MAYFTYLFLKKKGDAATPAFHWMVVSPDRDTADSFFRTLQENPNIKLGTDATRLKDLKLERLSSRMWNIDSSEADVGKYLHEALSGLETGADTVTGTVLEPFLAKIRLYWVGNRVDNRWRVLQPQTDVNYDNDWISGWSFFVRKRGYPNTYWTYEDWRVVLSQSHRHRFIVKLKTNPTMKDSKFPLTAEDEIEIFHVSAADGRQTSVKPLNQGAANVKFGDFLRRFYIQNGLKYSTQGNYGDGFELVEGIPPN